MARTKTLQSQLRDVALDYMKQVAKLLNRDPRDCHWVGTDDHERGIYTICDLGDITFLTLDQMQVIIDRLPEWLARYGSCEAVAQEIDDWMEWSIDPSNWLDGHPRINLEHWLMGCPREQYGSDHDTVKVASPKTVDNADFALCPHICDTDAFRRYIKMMMEGEA